MSPEEGALLSQYAAERDAEAFRSLVERHQRMVYGACLRVLGNAADAEDAAQDVFLQLARHAGRLRAPIAAWLHKVAVRAALETARKERRHREKAGAAMTRTKAKNEPTWDDMKGYVDEGIAALSANLRQPVILHFLEGRKQDEIAQEIGVTQATVSRRIQSAVTKLRAHLLRKGVTMSVAALAGLLAANAADAAVPATLTAALGKMVLAGPTTLKGAVVMKISAITLVAVVTVTAGIITFKSDAQQTQPLPPPPLAPIAQPASPTGVVAPRFDRVVPEWTPEGQAKGMGNALITLAGLAEKLEGTVQEGDEVHVPGWTEDDSRNMVKAIHDLVGADMFVGATLPLVASDSPPAEWLALLDSPDRATRIGAAVMMGDWFPKGQDVQREIDPVLSRAELMMKDADPYVRAAGVFMLNDIRSGREAQIRPMIIQALSDSAPCVRFAAMLSTPAGSSGADYSAEYQRLSEDSSSAVRFMAWLRLFSIEFNESGQHVSPAWVKNMVVRNPNPIARVLCIAMTSGEMLRCEPETGTELAEFLANNEDEWLRAVSAPFLPLIRFEGMPDGNALAGLLTSGKPSHEIIGLGTLFLLHQSGKPQAWGSVDEKKVMALSADSNVSSLWRRCAPAFVRSYLSGDAADEGLHESLCSPDEVIRVVNLFGTRGARDGEVPQKTKEQVAALSESPLLVESYLAQSVAAQGGTREELLDRFREAATDAPDAFNTRLLLMTIKDAVPRGTPVAEKYAFQEKVARILAESRNVMLQTRGFNEYILRNSGGPDGKNSAVSLLVKEMEPEAFRTVVLGYGRRIRPMSTMSVAVPVMERLTAMLKSEDGKTRAMAFELLPTFLAEANVSGLRHVSGTAPSIRDLLNAASDAFAADKYGSVGIMCQTLSAAFSRNPFSLLPWTEASPELQGAIVETLGYANHENHGAAVAELLGNLYASDSRAMFFDGKPVSQELNRILAVCPLVWNAMENARLRIMENGTDRDRLVMMLGITNSENWDLRDDVTQNIGKMLVEKRVPEDFIPEAVAGVAEQMYEAPPGCAQIVLETVKRDDISWSLRQNMISKIGVGAWSSRKKLPEWADEVARLGWEKATSETLLIEQRKGWLRMHMYAVPDAVSRTRELMLDVNQPSCLREALAELVPSIAPKSTIYREILPMLSQTEVGIKLALAKSAARASDTPGGEDLFIAVVTDESIPALRRARAFRYQSVPWFSKKLRTALTKLQEDPAMNECASQMLEQMK